MLLRHGVNALRPGGALEYMGDVVVDDLIHTTLPSHRLMALAHGYEQTAYIRDALASVDDYFSSDGDRRTGQGRAAHRSLMNQYTTVYEPVGAFEETPGMVLRGDVIIGGELMCECRVVYGAGTYNSTMTQEEALVELGFRQWAFTDMGSISAVLDKLDEYFAVDGDRRSTEQKAIYDVVVDQVRYSAAEGFDMTSLP